MMATVITIICVALLSGYIGSRIERRRSSSITKSEAKALIESVEEVKLLFEEHRDVHKVIVYDIDLLARDIAVIAGVVNLKRAQTRHNA